MSREREKKKMFVREKRDMREKQICRVFLLFTEACTKSTDYQGTEITMCYSVTTYAHAYSYFSNKSKRSSFILYESGKAILIYEFYLCFFKNHGSYHNFDVQYVLLF